MIPYKSKRSESRRSSILKPRKPRQPLQNVNFDSSSNENSPAVSKVKRRVSFAEKKHVKEFCHSTEQGTVWDNTYEEHDSSLKGSFVLDQSTETKLKKNTLLYTSNNDCIHIYSKGNLCHSDNVYLANNQLLQECVAKTNEKDNDVSNNLNFTNPVKSTELSNTSQLGYAALPSKPRLSKDAALSVTIVYSDLDEECMELPDKEFQSRQTVINTSKNIKSSNITIYRDSNEEKCADNIANKNFDSYFKNINTESDNTCVQDLSMDLTAPIPAFSLSSCLHVKQEKKQKHNNINNFDTNYTTNCNNMSMEITETVPMFVKSDTCDFGNSEHIPMILQNCKDINWNAANNPNTNLQSNFISKNISKCTLGVNYANDSMILTSVIQPFIDVTDTNVCHMSNTTSDISRKMTITSPKIYKKNVCKEDIIKENYLRKDQTDKTEIFNDVLMEMTKSISTILPSNVHTKKNLRMNGPISKNERTTIFHNVSMEMTNTISTRNKQDITTTSESLSKENARGRKDVNTSTYFNEGTRTLCKSTEFTEIVPTSQERMLHTTQSVKNPCENDKDDRIDSNGAPMEIINSVNILPLNIDKENLKIVESILKDDKTMFFHNVSMEMTKTISTTTSKQDVIATCESLSEKNAHGNKDVNTSACFNEGTRTLCKSMELTEIIPASQERMLYTIQSVKNVCENDKDDRTDSNNTLMEITKSVNILPLNIGEENLKIIESISKDDKPMLFHNVSMEMTTALSSRDQEKEVTQLVTCKSKEDTDGERNNSVEFNEGTKLLDKSMKFIEVVPISLHDKRTFNTTNTIYTTQSTSFSQTSETISLFAKNSVEIAYQPDTTANKTIQDISMEITGVPSTFRPIQDVKVNKTDNSIISKNNGSQSLMTNNSTKSRESVTKENLIISREIMDSETDCNSYIEVRSPQETDVSLYPNTNTNCISDVEHNEYFVKNTVDHTQISNSNLRNSLNEINKHSFKDLPCLKNSFLELQSIKPPSFVCLDSDEEEASHEIQCKPQSSTVADVPVNNTFNCLIIDDLTKSNCVTSSRENIADDYFTILRENEETINTEYNQAKDGYQSVIVDKTEDNQGNNHQTITETIIDNNESNYCTTKNINEDNVLSLTVKDGKAVTIQDINHCTSLIIKEINTMDENQIDEKEYTQKRINEDVKLQNNIKKKGEYLDKKIEMWNDHLEGIVIEKQTNFEEGRQNLSDEVKQQSMKQKNECATEELVMTQNVSMNEDIKNESLAEQDPFLTLSQKLETLGARDDCIWHIYYKNINRKMIVFGFMSNSLLVATFLSYDFNSSAEDLIERIKIISRLADDAGILIKIVHKLILEKISAEKLTNVYRTHQDIIPMLNFLSQEVKLAMDFMFDLRRLDDLNLMEIDQNEITFVSRSKRMDIILRVTIKIKRFDKLGPNDINLYYLLGKNRIKEIDIKNLIKNIKKDHKFLRRYMNDVKDYIDIMEETFKPNNRE
ncbi:putative uncharacterized protein DDB_G0282133 [Monomorium pharaonis]|uniref:putative uncharacterized protein DDB_G0282133 n=1 Tax=Monomorium pharaonis TaxID=307658 RepID=UPI00063FA789|nr:putative uncharacterized protein DDB_G0282133 [Monomorium pharaonis]XP_036147961.1 putative uncharacterized protein DDB_G0282133 [Monomorium pharaonis]